MIPSKHKTHILIHFDYLLSAYFSATPKLALVAYLRMRAMIHRSSEDPPELDMPLGDLYYKGFLPARATFSSIATDIGHSIPSTRTALAWLEAEGWVRIKEFSKTQKAILLGKWDQEEKEADIYYCLGPMEERRLLEAKISKGLEGGNLRLIWRDLLKSQGAGVKHDIESLIKKCSNEGAGHPKEILQELIKICRDESGDFQILSILLTRLIDSAGEDNLKQILYSLVVKLPTKKEEKEPSPPEKGERKLGVSDLPPPEKKSYAGINVAIFDRFDSLLQETPFLIPNFRGIRSANPAKIEATILGDHGLTLDLYATFLSTWASPSRIASLLSSSPAMLWKYVRRGSRGTKPPLLEMIELYQTFAAMKKENRGALLATMTYFKANPERKRKGISHLRKTYEFMTSQINQGILPDQLILEIGNLGRDAPYFEIKNKRETEGGKAMTEEEVQREAAGAKRDKEFEVMKQEAGFYEMDAVAKKEWLRNNLHKIND